MYSGTAGVYLIDTETKTKHLFQRLNEGCTFNFYNCIMSHSSIFQIEAESDLVVMELTKENIKSIAKIDIDLHDILE